MNNIKSIAIFGYHLNNFKITNPTKKEFVRY
jgi:hypothetical protein